MPQAIDGVPSGLSQSVFEAARCLHGVVMEPRFSDHRCLMRASHGIFDGSVMVSPSTTKVPYP
jgi:hypothetical protein